MKSTHGSIVAAVIAPIKVVPFKGFLDHSGFTHTVFALKEHVHFLCDEEIEFVLIK
jgi:hypothetical protein